MKTIKIFLASSEELSPEREKMADLVLHLNKLFKGRGIELDLEKWEYLVAATAKLYNNIGIVYYDLGDYDKAREYYKLALDIWEKVLQKEHPNTIWSYNATAWTLHLMGKYNEALPWAEKAVEAYPDNPGGIDTLATVYQGLSRYDEALEQFELCLKLQKEQNIPEGSIHETEEKIVSLKELKKNGRLSEQ